MDGKIQSIKKSLLQISDEISIFLKAEEVNPDQVMAIEKKYRILAEDLKINMNKFTNLRSNPPRYLHSANPHLKIKVKK